MTKKLIAALAAALALAACGAAGDGDAHCHQLAKNGFSVVEIGAACYTDVGGGYYLPVVSSANPRPIQDLLSEAQP